MDQFEQHLRSQPLNAPPADWRASILKTARQGRTGILPVTERIAENRLTEKSNATFAIETDVSTGRGIARERTSRPHWLRRMTGWKPVLRRTGILPVFDRIAASELAQKSNATVAVDNDVLPREGMSGEQTSRPGWLRLVTGRMPVLRDLFWPHPGAWAGLSAIWLLLFVMQHQMNIEIQEEIILAGIKPPVTDVMVAMEQHQIAIKQLLALNDLAQPVIDRPSRLPVSPTNLPPLMLLSS